MTTLKTLVILSVCLIIGCGTIGGFDVRSFPTPKQKVVEAIDTLFAKYPEYDVPSNWQSFNDWKERGYDFLDSRLFYFRSAPEEMYYVTFLGDSNNIYKSGFTSLAIRAINNGRGHWTLEDEITSSEKSRIQSRFDKEIIAKIEDYIDSKAISE